MESLHWEVTDDNGDRSNNQQRHGKHQAVAQRDQILIAGELLRQRHQMRLHKSRHFTHFCSPSVFWFISISKQGNAPR